MNDRAKLALECLRWAFDRRSTDIRDVSDEDVEWLADRKIDSLLFLSMDLETVRQSLYDKVWAVQQAQASRVLKVFAEAELNPIVFKGAEFLNRYFGQRSIHLLADVDVLIDRRLITGAKPVLHELGYRQAIYDKDVEDLVYRDFVDVAAIEGSHYELAPFSCLFPVSLDPEEIALARKLDTHPIWITSVDQAFVAVEFDVHHTVATDIECEPFFERSVASSFDGAKTLCPADQVWFTLTRLYNEVAIHSKISLRDFAYLAPLLSKETVNWDLVVKTANEYQLLPSLFYYLGFMRYLKPDTVPEHVIDQLNPMQSDRKRDWGWQLDKLFDLVQSEPFP